MPLNEFDVGFDILEASNADGSPIRLYEFRRGDTEVYRYCTADRNVERLGYVWTGVGVAASDEGIRQSGNSSQDEFRITLSSSTDIAKLWAAYAPSMSTWVTARDTHADTEECETSWLGTVSACDRSKPGQVTFSCANIAVSFERAGLRLAYTRNCPYALYDQATCKVDPAEFGVPGTIASFDGDAAVIPGLAAIAASSGLGFAGGFVEWDVGNGNREMRGLYAQNGDAVSLLGGTLGLSQNLDVIVYPGCARTTAACTLFRNLPRYGGMPGLPGKSPFDGTPVF